MDVLLALLLLCLVSILSAPPLASNELQGDLAAYLELSFRNPEVLETVYTRQSKFNLLAINQGTRDVYIGAVNRAYRLDSDFNQLQGIITHEYGDRSFSDRRDSYYTKLLIIDSARGLIICGSARGICELRNFNDIAKVLISSRSGVVSERNSSPVGIITSGERYLIVGESPDRYNAPLISRRNLEGNTFLEYNFYGSAITLSHYASLDFSVSYVTIYSWDSFTYFVTFQPVDVNARTSVSKVSRVCNEARDLDAYTEITIQCSGSDGSVYSLVQAAFFGPAGPDLAASWGLQADEQVLYAVFAKNRGAGDVPTDHSAMCVYRMTDVLAAFREAVRGCIQEGGAYRAWHLEESRCYSHLVPICFPGSRVLNIVNNPI
ncbi:plexin-A4-like [Acanthaster planci]|uniref:Plexin-A4-like n=1 Tax=Acanthaster planci TaxID=133434 RepID=A0A8B7Z4K2_ACAPL|nr:plexin-A4-like [Acanthaster planci]